MKRIVILLKVPALQKLTPDQRMYLDIYDQLVKPDLKNISRLFELQKDIEIDILKSAITTALNYHDAVRAKFFRNENRNWTKNIEDEWDDIQFDIIDLARYPVGKRKKQLVLKCEEYQNSFDIQKGKLIRFLFFKSNAKNKNRLFITAHHLIIDYESMGLLFDDIYYFYNQIKKGFVFLLLQKTSSIGQYAMLEKNMIKNEIVDKEMVISISFRYISKASDASG